jgi:hypothetical protein
MSQSRKVRLASIALEDSRGKKMQRTILTAAAMLLGSSLAVTMAKADMNYGPIVDQAKGLCFQKTTNTESGFFGYWAECPKAAATPAATATPAVHHRHAKHSEKDAQ